MCTHACVCVCITDIHTNQLYLFMLILCLSTHKCAILAIVTLKSHFDLIKCSFVGIIASII